MKLSQAKEYAIGQAIGMMMDRFVETPVALRELPSKLNNLRFDIEKAVIRAAETGDVLGYSGWTESNRCKSRPMAPQEGIIAP